MVLQLSSMKLLYTNREMFITFPLNQVLYKTIEIHTKGTIMGAVLGIRISSLAEIPRSRSKDDFLEIGFFSILTSNNVENVMHITLIN